MGLNIKFQEIYKFIKQKAFPIIQLSIPRINVFLWI